LMVPAFASAKGGSVSGGKATAGKPARKPVDETLFGKGGIAKLLRKGDIVIDGGNSFFEDSVRRAKRLRNMRIAYLDVGVSGGPGGAQRGASLMIGGDKKAYGALEDLWRALAVPGGYGYMGGAGAGHFVKMVHNGIEYGMMQAIGEGFALMKKSSYALDLKKITDVYQRGSVVRSKLVEWLGNAFAEFGQDLRGVSGTVAQTGEGRWTVKTAKKFGVPVPIIKGSVDFRARSEKHPSYIGQVLSALRNQFGGHAARRSNML
ncbi:MAG: NADP-dependent phosphogluconate dehydrogenase, partial [Candidatus Harrisonbacteria bacterium]|nr:NADP-dependent phosphogluconate dehydrogenase [Candidatus Harrisonbacteria bacterium]